MARPAPNRLFSLFADLRRRHVFRVAMLYIIGAWFLLQVADVTFPGLGIPEDAIRYVMIVAVIGFPVALVFGWLYNITPTGIVRTPPLSAGEAIPDISLRRMDYAILAALAVVAVITVWGLVSKLSDVAGIEPASIQRMVHPLPDKPSLAVLPFDNMSGDPGQEYFADGMTEDLITDLSKVPGLFVIARNSVFVYKNEPVDVRRVAESLGVRYILEGSVRRSGDTVRINAQLIDAVTGGHVWAERYDDISDDVFALQDRATERIVSALEVNLKSRPHGGTSNRQAHDAFLRGWAHYRRNTWHDLVRAVPFFERAVDYDPKYSRAYAALANIYWKLLDMSWITRNGAWIGALSLSWEEIGERHAANLDKALRDPTPLAHQAAAFKFSIQGRHDEAVEQADKAIALGPNDPHGYEAKASALIYRGEATAGAEAIRNAIRLDPLYPFEYLFWLGLAQFNMDEFELAADTLEQAVGGDRDDDRKLIVLAATYGHLGRSDEAERVIDTLEQLRDSRLALYDDESLGIDDFLQGPYTLDDVGLWPLTQASDRARLREGLRLAGVPESGSGDDVSPLFVDGATTIDVVEARRLHGQGAVFVDPRGDVDWVVGRIPGAHQLELESAFTEDNLADLVRRDQPVVMYCHGPACLRSSIASARAVSWGFTSVYYFRDGFPAWKAAGYPVETN